MDKSHLKSRRAFKRSGLFFTAGFAGLKVLGKTTVESKFGPGNEIPGFGKLVKDPKGILDLPAGFKYQIISKTGDTMSDGFLVPGAHDGMGAFEGPDGTTLLIRNHEINPNTPKLSPFGKDGKRLNKEVQGLLYDNANGAHLCYGGTTTLIYDTK